MEKHKELAKNTIIIFVGRFSTQFLSFLLLPIYTKVLSSAEYGTYDLIITYIALITPIVSLQIEMAVFRELIDARKNESRINAILSSSIFSILIQSTICIIIYLIVCFFINIPYSSLVLFNIIAVLLSNMLMQVARGLGENIKYSVSSIISGISMIFFSVFFLIILRININGLLNASILANTAAIIYLFISCRLYKRIKYVNINISIIFNLLKYSMPLIPNSLIWWIINVSDRTMISVFLGAGANGIYAISNKFSSMLIQVFNIFNLSWTESASLHIDDEDRDEFFSSIFNKTLKYSLLICLSLILILPLIFNLLIDKKYNDSFMYIPILIIGTIFNIIVSFLGSIYVAKKLTKEIAKTSFGAGALNIIINLLLISFIGIYAAAASTALSFLIMAIFRIIDVQKYVKLKIDIKYIYREIILFQLSILIYYINILPLSIMQLIIVSPYLIIQIIKVKLH